MPGWQIDARNLAIVEIPTVLGAWQRRQTVLLRCARPDCRRRVEVDLEGALKAGAGDPPIPEIVERLRCGHWQGCRLELASATYRDGVPLVGFLCHEGVQIVLSCQGCDARLLLPPRAMINRLKARGLGDGSVGVLGLGRLVRGPCRHCRGKQFTSSIIWPSPEAGYR